MTPFAIVLAMFALVFLVWLIGRYIPLPKDNGHFDSGFTKTQDGHVGLGTHTEIEFYKERQK